MKLSSVRLFVLCVCFALTSITYAQQPSNGTPAGLASQIGQVPIRGGSDGAMATVSVVDEKMNRLDRQAMVKLYDQNMKHATWQPTSKNADTSFEGLAVGKYDFEVTAIGYITARKDFEVLDVHKPVQLKVVLHPDPDAPQLSAEDPSLPPKASKEADRGVSDLKSGKYKDAQKHLESALSMSPNSAQANFLLGYLALQQNDQTGAQTYLNKAVQLDPHNIQALNLLGRLHLSQRDYAGAKATLEQAIAVDPQNSTAHGLLADAYLNLSDYKNALAQTDLAIAKESNPASNTQIVRGEALAHLGRDQEAIQTLKSYLQSAPDTAAGPQVEQLIALLEQHSAAAATPGAPAAAKP